MSKQSDYQKGRIDGLAMALRIAKEDGVDALEKELKLRGGWGMQHMAMSFKELDKMPDLIQKVYYQSMLIAVLSVLHDNFGFGQVRCQRVIDSFDKLTAYLDNGWLYWLNLVTELKDNMKLDIDVDALTDDKVSVKSYAHPDAEDIYEEQDLVNPEAWKKMLRENGFRDTVNDKGKHVVLDENGEEWFIYENAFDRISVYDAMQGVLWAKEHYGIGVKEKTG